MREFVAPGRLFTGRPYLRGVPDDSTRRSVLGTLGAAFGAAGAGCLELPFDAGTDGRSTQFAQRPPLASTAADGAESIYAQVYAAAVDSVVFVESGVGQGSGFVYDSDHVVTNQHVVGGDEAVGIRFSGGRWRTGAVVGRDPYADLAAVRVDDRPAYARPLSLSDASPSVGQEVVVLGYPLGLDASLSRGVVSEVDRSLRLQSGFVVPDAIQTDASINPGNSGGPLLTLGADVAGVITARRGSGVGFGISAALTRRVVAALLRSGQFRHTFLGIRYRELTPRIVAANDLDRTTGLLVVDVVDGGPAEGVLEPSTTTDDEPPVGGDVIVGLDDEAVHTGDDLSSYLALEASPGDRLAITVLRDGERRVVELTIAARPPPGDV